ncbi:transcription factor bHLH30-like [Phragmites australis]|uniref:transcription factor bHLH30-like n=1 Tax=Phragmites australis TaxID=29695 RepID=UPI002D77CB9F|nr:transcription factor bHLH30-like [Phragmites australis]
MGSAPFSDSGLFDGFFYGHELGQPGASTSSVLLDGRTEELNAASTEQPKRKGDHTKKAAMALKSHSEAERRRRERINAHLATLRSMVPCTDKMDKAALLAEVVTHVKRLKSSAARISRHCAVPADADDVAVELVHDAPSSSPSRGRIVGHNGGGSLVRATLSCDDGADLFADVKHALGPLRLNVVGSEVTTLGGRVRFTFLMSSCGDDVVSVDAVRQALQSVLDKANTALEFAPRASLLNKRRRVLTFESSCSSS